MKRLKQGVSLLLVAVMLLGLCACASFKTPSVVAAAPGDPTNVPQALQIDWNKRYSFEELEGQLQAMADNAKNIASLYSIGSSWQERDLWCLELTNPKIAASKKTGIGVFANIHGGERESASSAMYTAWWFVCNADDPYVKNILDKYIIYVVPVINPDGYEQSFVNNNRSNLRPTDRNGDGTAFSDPYTDIDGDGYIATIYRGKSSDSPSTNLPLFGMESLDWDKNGILGDDPRSSLIDMNRTFDYQWNRFDVETQDTGVIGTNSWSRAGDGPATEPEIKALQNFMAKKPMNALATLHTGIQCVLYPWCYRPYDAAAKEDASIPFMKDTAQKMADAFEKKTGRGFYTMSSYEDYPTSAEMIDYAYGTFGIHAYTIEVYSGGKSKNGDTSECKWENTLPEPKWTFYNRQDLKDMGVDTTSLRDTDGKPLSDSEGLWFYTNSTAQMVDKAPEDQDIMVKGALDSILTMIESEPYGKDYKKPFYVR